MRRVLRRVAAVPALPLLTAALAMLGAGRAGAAAPAVVHGIWHTRLMYHIRMASQLPATTDTRIFLSAEQPADCEPSHGQVDCRPAGDVVDSGHVYASGEAAGPAGNGGTVEETYQKSAHWQSPPADRAGALSPGLPVPSKVGAGLSVSLGLGAC